MRSYKLLIRNAVEEGKAHKAIENGCTMESKHISSQVGGFWGKSRKTSKDVDD